MFKFFFYHFYVLQTCGSGPAITPTHCVKGTKGSQGKPGTLGKRGTPGERV